MNKEELKNHLEQYNIDSYADDVDPESFIPDQNIISQKNFIKEKLGEDFVGFICKNNILDAEIINSTLNTIGGMEVVLGKLNYNDKILDLILFSDGFTKNDPVFYFTTKEFDIWKN